MAELPKKLLTKPKYVYALWSVACLVVVCALTLGYMALTVKDVSSGAASGTLYVPSDSEVVKQLSPGYAQMQNQGVSELSDEGYGIFCGRLQLALCKTEEDAQWVLDSLLCEQTMEGAQASFVEDVSIRSSVGSILGREEALMVISGGTDCLPYVVDTGECVTDICTAFSMTTQEYESLNASGSDADSLVPGQFVTVKSGAGPLLTVQNVLVETEEESIPYDTKTVNDSSIYKGKSIVKQAGVRGVKTRTVTITYVDGAEISRDTTEFAVTKEPVDKIVHKGTKAPADAADAPNFIWPLSGPISSPFGPRWGRMHYGIDIAISEGTSVKAAASGTVLRAFDNGGYGLFVEIDHGGGWITRYGHNSKLLVKPGDHVSRGEVISKSGNTGTSTGPHLHFEIRKNGTPVDPQLYLP